MSQPSGKGHGIKRTFYILLDGELVDLLTSLGLATRSFVISWIESPLEIQPIQTDRVGTEFEGVPEIKDISDRQLRDFTDHVVNLVALSMEIRIFFLDWNNQNPTGSYSPCHYNSAPL